MLAFVVALALTLPLFGHVVDRQTGEPLPGCNVELGGGLYRIATDSTGAFALPDVPAGYYELTVNCPSYDPLYSTIHRRTAANDSLRLTLRRTPFARAAETDSFSLVQFGDLFVMAMDSLENRQQGVLVRLPALNRQALTDSFGTFTFEEVPFGRYVVEALSPIHEAYRDTVNIVSDGPLMIGIRARLLPAFTPGEARLNAQGNASALVNGTWLPVTSRGRLPKPLRWDPPKRTYRK